MLVLLCISAGLYLALLAGKATLGARYARCHPAPVPRAAFPDVTIMQPILGGDPTLAETLGENLRELPGAQFIWLLDSDDTAGWTAARAAHAAQPGARVDFVRCPPVPAAANPKIFKLARAEPAVTTPFVVVLDDDTRLTAVGLTAMLDALRDHDVATGLPFYLAGANVPSKLVAQFVNNQSLLTYLPLLVWRPPITLNGMAYALAAARWRALGGFAPLTQRLADDLAVARLVRDAHGRIFQTIVPHAIATSVCDLRHYGRVMHRWFLFALLLVRAQPFRWRLAILALHGLPPVLLWLALAAAGVVGGASGWGTAGVLLFVRGGLIWLVQKRHLGRGAHAPVWSLVAELLQPLHLVRALVSRRIHWRTRVIDVRADDDFSYV